MRTKNVMKNVIFNFLSNFLLYLLRFVSRTVFIKTIGELYLGVNGLLSNVLGLLALAELGISTTIGYNLYKPLKDDDKNKIRSYMIFYKKAYRVVSLIVTICGVCLLPFLPWLIKDTSGISNLSIIYLIYLTNMVIGYLFSYKRVLITSDQKNYKIMPIIMATNTLQNVLQIVVLLIFKNYILYLLIQSFTTILENLFVNKYIDKKYPYLKKLKYTEPLTSDEMDNIKKGVKGIFVHKIGSYVLNSTDNLVISKIVGIVQVGLFSNYILLKNMIKSFLDLITGNMISSIGNLLASEKNEKKERVFDELKMFGFCVYCITTICFINLFNPFIKIWLGEEFLFSQTLAVVISLNYYLSGMVGIVETFKGAAGLYYNDRIIPIVQSVVNLIISIILSFEYGVLGVMLGTFISYIVPLIVKPIVVYKNIFNKSSIKYFLWFTKKTIVFAFLAIITHIIINYITIFNPFVNIFVILAVSTIIPFVVLFFLYRKDQSILDFIGRIKIIVKRK